MPSGSEKIDKGLDSLRIDRSERRAGKGPPAWTKWWILTGIALVLVFGIWRFGFAGAGAVEVETLRVTPRTSGDSGEAVVLEAAGYVVAHHKIELTPKVVDHLFLPRIVAS